MNALHVLQQVRELGITLKLDGDRIRYAPKSKMPSDLAKGLSQHKTDIIYYLRQEERGDLIQHCRLVYPDSRQRPEELQEISRRVQMEGYVLLWSTVLEDLVAFYRTEADLRKIPAGFVAYSDQELRELFGDGKSVPSPKHLRLIHEAKKRGGQIIDSN